MYGHSPNAPTSVTGVAQNLLFSSQQSSVSAGCLRMRQSKNATVRPDYNWAGN